MNWIRIVICPMLLVLLTGCFQSDTAIYLRPDGSGYVEITNLMSAEMVDMMSFMTELAPEEGDVSTAADDTGAADPPGPPDLFSEAEARAAVASMGDGVRFKSVEPMEKTGFVGSKAVYEFTDITKLRLDAKPDALPADPTAGEPMEELVAFSFHPSGEKSLLAVRMPDSASDENDDSSFEDDGSSDLAEGDGVPSDTELEMLRNMFDGLKFGMRVIPIGKLIETNSIHVAGDEVTLFEIDFGALLANPEALQQVAAQDEPESFAEIAELLQSIPGIKINPVEEITIEFAEK